MVLPPASNLKARACPASNGGCGTRRAVTLSRSSWKTGPSSISLTCTSGRGSGLPSSTMRWEMSTSKVFQACSVMARVPTGPNTFTGVFRPLAQPFISTEG
ncbi:hypothetical protein D3C85_1309610 [compost metagenome]